MLPRRLNKDIQDYVQIDMGKLRPQVVGIIQKSGKQTMKQTRGEDGKMFNQIQCGT